VESMSLLFERMFYMKLLLKIVLSIIVIFVLVAGGGMFYLTRGLEEGSKLAINTVNLSTVVDGVYKGKYHGGRWSNEVAVTVKDHKITKVEFVKDVRFSRPEILEEMVSKVISKQNTDVDVISGSTVTCKAYLKSIENALTK